MLRKNQNRIFLLLALLSIMGMVVLYYSQTLILERFETHTYDLRFKELRGAITPHPDIAIIAINEITCFLLFTFATFTSLLKNLIHLSKIRVHKITV